MEKNITHNIFSIILFSGLLLLVSFVMNSCVSNGKEKTPETKVPYLTTLKASLYDKDNPMVMINVDLPLPKKLILKNSDYKKYALHQLIEKKPKIIFRYNSKSCDVCTNLIIGKLKALAKKIGAENIIMLTTYDTDREFKIAVMNNGIEKNAYQIPDNGLGLPLEDKDLPYLFVLDKDMKASQVFIPLKELPEKTDEYFAIVTSKYYQ